jgi:hypothetical protein
MKTAKGKWMIEIRYAESGELVGIPLRGVAKDLALEMADPVRFTFEYAVGVSSAVSNLAIHSIDCVGDA